MRAFAIRFLRARTYRGDVSILSRIQSEKNLTVNERLITSGERCRGPAGFMTCSCCVRARIHACELWWDCNATRRTARAGPSFHHLRLIGFIDERRPKPMRAVRYETSSRDYTRCKRESIFGPLSRFLITEIELLLEIGFEHYEAKCELAYSFINDISIIKPFLLIFLKLNKRIL